MVVVSTVILLMVPSPGGISPVTLGRPSAGPNRLAHCPTRRSRPGCWPCRQGREKIPETLPECLQVASNGDPNAFQWPRFVMLLMYPPTEETKHDGDSNAADGPFDRERAVRQVRELLGLDLGVTFHRRDQIRQLIGRQPAGGVIGDGAASGDEADRSARAELRAFDRDRRRAWRPWIRRRHCEQWPTSRSKRRTLGRAGGRSS